MIWRNKRGTVIDTDELEPILLRRILTDERDEDALALLIALKELERGKVSKDERLKT